MDEIAAWIRDSADEREMEELYKALKDRRRTLVLRRRIEFKPDSVVTFNSLIRPLYLKGAKAVVEQVRESRVDVRLEQQINRYPAGAVISCAPDVLKKEEHE